MKNQSAIFLCFFLLFFSSCTTYHLSTQSLLSQFAHTQQEKKITLLIAPPYFFYPGIVRGNNLRKIEVQDKHQGVHVIPVTRHTGVRITQKSGKKTTFYFDTLLLQDSTIAGSKTHFFNAKIRPIKFENIALIQVQK